MLTDTARIDPNIIKLFLVKGAHSTSLRLGKDHGLRLNWLSAFVTI